MDGDTTKLDLFVPSVAQTPGPLGDWEWEDGAAVVLLLSLWMGPVCLLTREQSHSRPLVCEKPQRSTLCPFLLTHEAPG